MFASARGFVGSISRHSVASTLFGTRSPRARTPAYRKQRRCASSSSSSSSTDRRNAMLDADQSFARRMASVFPPSAVTASDAGKAVDLITTRIVLGVFEQEHFEEEWQSTGQQWTVTLNQLLRAVLGYQGWTVCTTTTAATDAEAADGAGAGATTGLVTGSTQDGRATLSAFLDSAALCARAENEGATPGTVESMAMTAQELLLQWHTSLEAEPKIAAIAFHSYESCTEPFPASPAFGEQVLRPMLGLALAMRAEHHIYTLACWMRDGQPADAVPAEALKELATQPFYALIHAEEQRLLSPPPGGPLLVTAPDLLVATQLQLGADAAAQFKVAPYTVLQVAEALLQSEQSQQQQIQLMYGWGPVPTNYSSVATDKAAGAAGLAADDLSRRVLSLPPAAELVALLKEHAAAK